MGYMFFRVSITNRFALNMFVRRNFFVIKHLAPCLKPGFLFVFASHSCCVVNVKLSLNADQSKISLLQSIRG